MGTFACSMRSFEEPCASWHVVQPSRMGACSHRYGPRFSAWQEVQDSLTESPALSSFTFVLPWTSWQEVHSILPSRTGMWPDLLSLATLSLWQVPQSSIWVAVLSCFASDFGLWTLWHVVHARPRDSCWLPSHNACGPRS
jgi:hypothetical protein